MKILITAFEPFGDSKQNSAHLAMELLPEKTLKHTIIKETLPVVYNKSIAILKDLIKKHSPNIVICLGQAAGAHNLKVERIAINLDDAKAKDNIGITHIDLKIIKGDRIAYMATLPTREMMDAAIKTDVPASISYSAGNYVCNHIMYGLLSYIDDKNIIGGFIHLPLTPAQAADKPKSPSMTSQDAKKALLAMIEVL